MHIHTQFWICLSSQRWQKSGQWCLEIWWYFDILASFQTYLAKNYHDSSSLYHEDTLSAKIQFGIFINLADFVYFLHLILSRRCILKYQVLIQKHFKLSYFLCPQKNAFGLKGNFWLITALGSYLPVMDHRWCNYNSVYLFLLLRIYSMF